VGHLRIKVPQTQAPGYDSNRAATEWHQDNGVVLAEADDLEVVTAWIPLTNATVENGCLQVIPAQRDHKLLVHCEHLAIPRRLLDRAAVVPVPMDVGSLLFLHPRIPHASLPNVTRDQVRISLDLRYQPSEQRTGRPYFPAFCVRHPRGKVASWMDWREGWLKARARWADRAVGPFDRWDMGAPGCA
jgi:phytanoyl-CoA hydroxylase